MSFLREARPSGGVRIPTLRVVAGLQRGIGEFKLNTLDPFSRDSPVREVGALEAKNRLGALLDLVEAGEEIVILRHGRPVARLVSEAGPADRRRARAAAERILHTSEGVSLGGIKISDLIDEGRP